MSDNSLGLVSRSQIERFLAAADVAVLATRPQMNINPPFGLLPGSFNPLHQGHRGMLKFAQHHLPIEPQLELSVTNVDKRPLTVDEVWRRLNALLDHQVWLTKAPTFVQKSLHFPQCTFLVGADTIVRIADPAYYQGSTQLRDDAVKHLQQQQANFVVFGRLADGQFRDGSNLQLPTKLASMSQFVPEAEFRCDVSSSELRGG